MFLVWTGTYSHPVRLVTIVRMPSSPGPADGREDWYIYHFIESN